MPDTMKYRTLIAASLCGLAAGAAAGNPPADGFFAPVPDRAKDLPAQEPYPRGRLFPFWGYSGDFAREKKSGFTLGGQHYGGYDNQLKALARAREAGLRYMFSVGLPGRFTDGSLVAPPESWADAIAAQIRPLGNDTAIAFWAIHPEELRMWRKNELQYLRVVTETIRANDALHRPIFMYEPNNRTADGMVISAEHLDFVSRGAYVQSCGYQNERVWVRWVIAQEVEAARRLKERDGRDRPAWFMGQLSEDPADPADDDHIPAWVRHDVYAALISGARGVGIWSLWPRRPGVQRTYEAWYGAYATVARELTGPMELGQVFLFGEERSDLKIRHLSGPETVVLRTGPRNNVESNTTHASERHPADVPLPSLASCERAWHDRRYFFLCNSSPEAIEVELSGWPEAGCEITNAFTGHPIQFQSSLRLHLPPWGVEAFVFRPVHHR